MEVTKRSLAIEDRGEIGLDIDDHRLRRTVGMPFQTIDENLRPWIPRRRPFDRPRVEVDDPVFRYANVAIQCAFRDSVGSSGRRRKDFHGEQQACHVAERLRPTTVDEWDDENVWL